MATKRGFTRLNLQQLFNLAIYHRRVEKAEASAVPARYRPPKKSQRKVLAAGGVRSPLRGTKKGRRARAKILARCHARLRDRAVAQMKQRRFKKRPASTR